MKTTTDKQFYVIKYIQQCYQYSEIEASQIHVSSNSNIVFIL